jgi:FtsZ-interacting cell division protein ZipA
MKKTILIILLSIAVVGLIIGGYFVCKKYFPFWEKKASSESQAIDQASKAADLLGEKTSQGTLPDITSKNPLQNKPDVNPVDQTNPFKDLKTNPFE